MKKSVVVLLHIGFWFMYLLLLAIILAMPAHFSPKSNEMAHQIGHVNLSMILLSYLLVASFSLIPALISFYAFYTYLFSKYFVRKKIRSLCLSGILVCIFCGLFGTLLANLVLHAIGKDGSHEPLEFVGQICAIALNALACGIIGLVIKGFITSYGDIKLKADLEIKNHEVELALVKSQINPHFLFNTLNNIDVLIEKDAVKASVYLNKLSDIMRFMLYEGKAEEIPLKQELTYIEKYIELQKIRTSNPNYVNYHIEGDAGSLMIAPMLFIPFIENAFKHAENKKMEGAITINVVIEHTKIIFECNNSYSTDTQTKLGHGGLGNELIQKRLMLIYPNKHTLKITNENKMYKVKLILNGN